MKKKPWWKEPIAWLVFSGPIIVVIAGLTTLFIAKENFDPEVEVSADYYGEQLDATQNEIPAMKGRNHVATPTEDIPN